jgi:TnpA family transposase
MTTIDRTAYPRFKRALSERDLTEVYTLTEDEHKLINRSTSDAQTRLNFALLLKSCQRLAYFPQLTTIPKRIITHIRQQLQISAEIAVGYEWKQTRLRHYKVIRSYLSVRPYRQGGGTIAETAMRKAVQSMMYPADLINVAIEELVRQSYLLPAFSTLNRLASHIRVRAHDEYFQRIMAQLKEDDHVLLDGLLTLDTDNPYTNFTSFKQITGRLTRRNIDLTIARLDSLSTYQHLTAHLSTLPSVKIGMFAAQAYAMEVGDLLDTNPPRRYALLLCFLHHVQTRLRDDLATMLVKRMNKVRNNAKKNLDDIKREQMAIREAFIDMFAHVVHLTQQTPDDTKLGKNVRQLVDNAGGAERLWEDYEAMMAYHQNNYRPLIWRNYSSYRRALFDVIDILDIQSTTQDQLLIEALAFIQSHRYHTRKYLADEINISFLSQRWQQLIIHYHKGKRQLNRRHLEAAVFMTLASELKTGDVYVVHSEDYADYRQQLLSWQDCKPHLEVYCKALNLPTTAKKFVEQLQKQLKSAIQTFNDNFLTNETLAFDTDNRLTLKRLTKQETPDGLDELEYQLQVRLPQRQILDILSRLHHWFPFSRHFGPASGSQTKMVDADARYLLTLFGYGCNLGPKQTAQHSRLPVTRRILQRINSQHISIEQLDKAIRDTINQYARFDLPRFWGTGRVAAADGTQFDLYSNNLLAEQHVRYGGYGGIAYHHISDTYVALFSHFINVGVWEAVYIFDGLLQNTSDIQPDTLHADTHGQSEPVFGLSHLLGIQLMPRIRNWKKLTFYRVDEDDTYAHVDDLFTAIIDWDLILTHWQDLMQVAISIQQGHVLPSMLLRKLRHDSNKNRLYRAFREVGRVIRTIFLLRYVANPQLRRQVNTVTNQMESYNGFSKWLFFGDDGTIKHNDPVEQEKRIKYNDLISNLAMLHNLIDMTELLQQLKQEGYAVNSKTLARISPYLTEHIRRFGEYIIDMNQTIENIPFELDLAEGA